jgi:hypothetical protein
MKKYKHIYINELPDEQRDDKPVYGIFNNNSNVIIGQLSFYNAWNQYVFESAPDCIFSASCLRDVIDFIENGMPGDVKRGIVEPIIEP